MQRAHRRMDTPWQDVHTGFTGDPFPLDVSVDAVVVGAGLTGLLCADRLRRQGRSVVVIERRGIAGGCTGVSTGHLSWLFDVGIPQLRKQQGDDTARLVLHAMRAAVHALGARLQELDPTCVRTGLPAWMVATDPDQDEILQDSLDALRALDLPAEWIAQPELPIPTRGGYRCPDQARIDPAAAAMALARSLQAAGTPVVTHTGYTGYERDGDGVLVETEAGSCRASALVLATHTPPGINPVQTAVRPMLSCAVALRVAEELPDALIYDQHEPYRYLRRHELPDGQPCLVVGGGDRSIGGDAEADGLRELRDFAARHFSIEAEVARWSGMYFHPSDALPFIGRLAGRQPVWYATGFSGDGLTWAELAADIMASGIAEQEHPLAEVVRPQRLGAALTVDYLKQNLHAGKHFIRDRLPGGADADLDAMPTGSGAVIGHGAGHMAVARLEDGLHAHAATCPHMGCRVHYNALGRSFDCPCHGSRFGLDGRIIEGPATRGLAPAELEDPTR